MWMSEFFFSFGFHVALVNGYFRSVTTYDPIQLLIICNLPHHIVWYSALKNTKFNVKIINILITLY